MESFKIGIAQYSPVHMNLGATLKKVEQIFQSLEDDVDLIVFGETWLSGYPGWLDSCRDVGLWDHEPMKEVYLKFRQNSVKVPGAEVKVLADLAKKYNTGICIGVNEKVEEGTGNGTIYNSLLTINENGELVNHHRKLMPTFTEKLVYGTGDGNGLKSVDVKGIKVGGLICWEHWMPLARQTMHNAGEILHVAAWPRVHEMLGIASRHYAFEGRCFVVAVGQIMKVSDIPKNLDIPDNLRANPDELLLNGGSCLIGPDGKFIVEPIFDKETIIYATINPEDVYKERMTLDTSGHYQRKDVFSFEVNHRRI